MMTRCGFLHLVVLFGILLCGDVSAQESSWSIIARQSLNEIHLDLDPAEKAWVERKGKIVVGIKGGSYPPYRIFTERNEFEGVLADYLIALQREFGIPFELRIFETHEAAFDALHKGEVDLLGNTTFQEAREYGAEVTTPYVLTEVALFSEGGDIRHYDPREEDTRIAVGNKTLLEYYQRNHGLGVYTYYSSPATAMSAVLMGDVDVYLGDTFSTQYLSRKLFSNQIVVNQTIQFPKIEIGFALLPASVQLEKLLNRALGNLSRCDLIKIQSFWADSETCTVLDFRSSLSEAERAWIEKSGPVSLAVSEDLAPYAFFNTRGRFNGIASDLLELIRVRTGLSFDIRRVRSLSDAAAQLDQGRVSLGIMPANGQPAERRLQSRALASAPFVVVQRKAEASVLPADGQLEGTLAVTNGYFAKGFFAQNYPKVKVHEAATVAEAFRDVRDGRADFTLATTNVARYYLTYKYEDTLKYSGIFPGADAFIVFAAAPGNEELLSIIDKAMLDIPPEKYLQIVGRWRANFATDDLYWEGLASSTWHAFGVLGGLLALAALLIVALRQRVIRKQKDLLQRKILLDELQDAKESAEKASRSKSVFLATMSHEIRTPLNAIIGMLELVLTRKGNAELNRESVHIAYDSANSLLALIGDILDISRIEAGNLVLSPERVRVKELLTSVSNIFSALARQKQLRVHLDIDELAAEDVWIDSLKFKQIISNLLSNAIKFTEKGEITIRCRVNEVGDGSLAYRISVTDTGMGIPEEQIGQIFSAFFVVDNAVTDPNSGAGLGLSISHALAQLMGGHLSVESQLGHGTTMTFEAVFQRVAADVGTGEGSQVPLQRSDVPLNILIVEDHLPSQYLLYQQIVYLGHHALTASNGVEGLAIWAEGDVDVIITDCNMPELDGHEMTGSIRRLEVQHGRRPCLIIGLTADAQRAELERCRDSGMDHALAKPVNLAALNRFVPMLSGDEGAHGEEGHRPYDDIQAAIAEGVVASNEQEAGVLRQALEQQDLLQLRRTAHKLKGTAYLLNHASFLELCIEVEECCSVGMFSIDVQEAVTALLEMLDDINLTFKTN